MSLQVWLPLNGTLENKGLSDVTLTNNGATVNTSGKIGSCYSFDGNGYISGASPDSEGCSMSLWIKCDPASLTNNVVCADYKSMLGFGFYTTYIVTTITNNTTCRQVYDKTLIPSNTWTHIVIVRNFTVPKMYLYINGVEQIPMSGKTDAWGSGMSDGFTIGARTNGANKFIGQINDLRIYDHCLSAKEVKELSKGLIGHWPLNDYHSVGPINKYSSPYSDGELSASSWTKTKLADERGWNYKLTRTGTGTNVWVNGAVPNFTFTVGKTYYYSVKVRCHKWSVGALALRAARCNNDWVTRSINVCEPSKADGEWHEYYTYQTIPESFDRSGTTVTSNPVFEFYSSAQGTKGTVYDMDFDVKDIQVVESNEYLPFIDNAITDTTIYDCSGYGRNGSITGSLTVSSDTPRYSVCDYFNGSSYIKTLPGEFSWSNFDTITIAAWIKPTTTPSTWTGSIGIAHDAGSGNKCFSISNYGGKFTVHTVNGNYVNTQSSYTMPLNVWHHYVAVLDGTTVKMYVDGALVHTATISWGTTTVHANPQIQIGVDLPGGDERYTGYYSDVRIYATALSATDIKELYETAASVDKNGNFWGYELSEL